MTAGAAKIKRRIERLFHDWLARAQHGLRRFEKDELADAERARRILSEILAAIQAGNAAALVGDMTGLLSTVTQDGGAAALAQVGIVEDRSILAVVNQRAVNYARDRSAEMVGMKWVDGELVENPSAQWRIDDSTRELLRGDVTAALKDGLSNDALAERIAGSYAFSDDRALMIARTETAFADVAGNMIAYRESGEVEQKQWITGEGCCDDCLALDKIIVDIDEDFPDDGGDGPPLHPNCRCDVVPLLREPKDPFTEE